DLILCGAFVGLSLYTYTSSRTVPFVVAFTLGAGVLFGRRPHLPWRRGLAALAVIAATAMLVFAPLGLYFLNHWDIFSDRASEVSIFNQAEAPQGPLYAFVRSTVRTALMFVTLPDSNMRHNPAQRPVFDWVLAAWLVIGLLVALAHWRRMHYLFSPLWFGLLAVPALLTAPAMPHSLRTIGMIPAAYLLVVMAMQWVGTRAPGRFQRWALWLPLPFLLYSSITGVQAYFSAWQQMERFRGAFMTDYVKIGQMIAKYSSPDSVWILPRSPNYRLEDASPAMFTVNFLVRDQTGYGSVVFGEAQAPQQLTQLTQDRHLIHVLQVQDAEFLTRVALVFADSKNLLDFLLHKHGHLVQETTPLDIGMPYKTFEVQPGASYLFDQNPISTTLRFADKVELVQLDYGRTVMDLAEPVANLAQRRAPAGHELWVVLRWRALTPVDYDLKSSLILKDAAGHVAAQVDELLTGDHYPVIRLWDSGERASSYHILPIPPAIPPGQYRLYLKVYEDATGRVYPGQDQAGQPLGLEVPLGPFEITPGPAGVALAAEQQLASPAPLAKDLSLTGFDLPHTTVAPGDKLPVTLYWQAPAQPAADYTVQLQLLDSSGAPIAEQRSPPGGNEYPTTGWRAGETLRTWLDLPLSPTTPAGSYDLVLTLRDGERVSGRQALGQVTVQGRVRQFAPPALAQPVEASFGQQVRLLGIDAPSELRLLPGATISFTLAWQVMARPPGPLVRFVHLLGADGKPVAQQDTTPCNGECPATSWLENEILSDPASLTLPTDLPPGEYRLITGWYDQATV
ncbi:MAG TPA: hypothetical protein PKE45_20970, partial [Caldilineaceae bacterium]|nr:hypothetical protein [Caldilineaceae bacterium]